VDEKNNFEPQYVILPRPRSHSVAARSGENVDKVYLAQTSTGKRSHRLACHRALKLSPDQSRRITFHEITPEAIKDALEHPRKVDMTLVHAQQGKAHSRSPGRLQAVPAFMAKVP